jgi:hypothetical protein
MNILQFLSCANFYCRFADGSSKVARPLTEQTKEDAKRRLTGQKPPEARLRR